MTIKQQGGIFGRNPTFNDVEVEGTLDVTGNFSTSGSLNLDGNLSVDTDILYVDASSNRVGVKTSSPSTDFEVEGVAVFGNGTNGVKLTYSNSADAGIFDTSYTADKFEWRINNVRKLRLEDSGNLVMNSGSGIDFSATSGTGTSELFDDYEEGTWTPTLTTSGTDFGSVTYDALTSGYYTKVGNLVHIQGYMRTDGVTVGSASGSVLIGGLPFTSVSNSSGKENGFSSVSIGNGSSWAGEIPLSGIIAPASTTIFLYYRSSSTSAPSTTATSDVGTGSNNNQLRFSATYVAG